MQALLAGLGGFIGICVIGILAKVTQMPWVIASFGASCVLLFGYPDAPFSRARNVIGGHVLTAAVAVGCLSLFGPGLLPMAFAMGLAALLMVMTDTPHPPAGSNPLIVFLAAPLPDWQFIFMPVLVGAVTLYLTAQAYWWAMKRYR